MAAKEAACTAVYLHGLAGNLFETKYPQQGLNAMDIVKSWNDVVHYLRTTPKIEDELLNIHLFE